MEGVRPGTAARRQWVGRRRWDKGGGGGRYQRPAGPAGRQGGLRGDNALTGERGGGRRRRRRGAPPPASALGRPGAAAAAAAGALGGGRPGGAAAARRGARRRRARGGRRPSGGPVHAARAHEGGATRRIWGARRPRGGPRRRRCLPRAGALVPRRPRGRRRSGGTSLGWATDGGRGRGAGADETKREANRTPPPGRARAQGRGGRGDRRAPTAGHGSTGRLGIVWGSSARPSGAVGGPAVPPGADGSRVSGRGPRARHGAVATTATLSGGWRPRALAATRGGDAVRPPTRAGATRIGSILTNRGGGSARAHERPWGAMDGATRAGVQRLTIKKQRWLKGRRPS